MHGLTNREIETLVISDALPTQVQNILCKPERFA